MNRRFIFNHFIISDRLKTLVLIVLWVTGICFGICLSAYNRTAITPELQDSLVDPVPFYSPLTAAIPLLLVSILLLNGFKLGIYPVLFFWGVTLGFSAFFIYCVFGSCAWLLRIFLLFTTGCISVTVWWLILRHFHRKMPSFETDILLVAFFCFLLFAFERSLVSPYLQSIIKYL